MRALKPCLINCELFGKRSAYFESTVVPLWKDVYDSLVARSRIAKGSKVLDVGSGTGEVAMRLAKAVGRGGSVVAIDAQEEMLQIARCKAESRGIRNIDFRQMPMEDMALADGSFDSVLGNYSLCCCMDYRAALSECLRVLKPGGRLTYNHNGPRDPLARQVVFDIFERYKTTTPSKKLKDIRASNAAQVEAFEKYRNPFIALDRSCPPSFERASIQSRKGRGLLHRSKAAMRREAHAPRSNSRRCSADNLPFS